MVQLTTQEVTISVESFFQESYSNSLEEKFIYAYHIRITNAGSLPVQLLNRTWMVTDGAGERRFVKGEGVVGQQPNILPGQTYEYTSWVQFQTPMGTMEGSYGMVRIHDNGQEEHFSVEVPRFLLLAPEVLN